MPARARADRNAKLDTIQVRFRAKPQWLSRFDTPWGENQDAMPSRENASLARPF